MDLLFAPTADANDSIYKRLKHFAELRPVCRKGLLDAHARFATSRQQHVPEEYHYLFHCHLPIMERYRLFRQFYDQLTFRADTNARYFTFLDTANYSYWSAPSIRIGKLNAANSQFLIQQLMASGKIPEEKHCILRCGTWYIATRSHAMIDALKAQGSVTLLNETLFFRSWTLNPEQFEQIRNVIIQHQGKLILPFRDEANMQLTPRQLTELELKQMLDAKDAWL